MIGVKKFALPIRTTRKAPSGWHVDSTRQIRRWRRRSKTWNVILFLFSSRRRHTTSHCDWSSDVVLFRSVTTSSRREPELKPACTIGHEYDQSSCTKSPAVVPPILRRHSNGYEYRRGLAPVGHPVACQPDCALASGNKNGRASWRERG